MRACGVACARPSPTMQARWWGVRMASHGREPCACSVSPNNLLAPRGHCKRKLTRGYQATRSSRLLVRRQANSRMSTSVTPAGATWVSSKRRASAPRMAQLAPAPSAMGWQHPQRRRWSAALLHTHLAQSQRSAIGAGPLRPPPPPTAGATPTGAGPCDARPP